MSLCVAPGAKPISLCSCATAEQSQCCSCGSWGGRCHCTPPVICGALSQEAASSRPRSRSRLRMVHVMGDAGCWLLLGLTLLPIAVLGK